MDFDRVKRLFREQKQKDEYVFYGAGYEAEKFLYRTPELQGKIKYCIDKIYKGSDFHGAPVYSLEEAPKLHEYAIIVASIWQTFIEIREELEKLGMREFYDFVWCYIIGKKIAIVNANCHGPVLLKYLQYSQTFLDNYCIYPIPEIQYNERKEIGDDLLKVCEIYIHQDIQSENSIDFRLSDKYVLSQLSHINCKTITIPNFVEMARWLFPQQGAVSSPGIYAGDRLVHWYDEVLEYGYKKGFRFVEEYMDLYYIYIYSEKFLQESFERDMNKLKSRERNWDVKVTDYILHNFRHIPCFVDARHPSVYLMRHVGRQVAELLGCYDIFDDSRNDYDEIKSLLGMPIPLLGCVRRKWGISYYFSEDIRCHLVENYYPIENRRLRKKLSMQEYISSYMWCSHDIRVANKGTDRVLLGEAL